MGSNDKLDSNGLGKVWERVFGLVKKLTGDVDVAGKGNLQEQVNKLTETETEQDSALKQIQETIGFSSKNELDISNMETGTKNNVTVQFMGTYDEATDTNVLEGFVVTGNHYGMPLYFIISDLDHLISGEDYILSADWTDAKSDRDENPCIVIKDESSNVTYAKVTPAIPSVTFTAKKGQYVSFGVYPGFSFSQYRLKPMIRKAGLGDKVAENEKDISLLNGNLGNMTYYHEYLTDVTIDGVSYADAELVGIKIDHGNPDRYFIVATACGGTVANVWGRYVNTKAIIMCKVTEEYDSGWYTISNSLIQYQANNTITDCLHVGTGDPAHYANVCGVINTEDASTLINSPVTNGAFYATREVQHIKSSGGGYKINVILRENWPKYGRVWTNCYNPDTPGWSGWDSDVKSSDVGNKLLGNVTFYTGGISTEVVSHPIVQGEAVSNFKNILVCLYYGIEVVASTLYDVNLFKIANHYVRAGYYDGSLLYTVSAAYDTEKTVKCFGNQAAVDAGFTIGVYGMN